MEGLVLLTIISYFNYLRLTVQSSNAEKWLELLKNERWLFNDYKLYNSYLFVKCDQQYSF